MTVDPNKIDHKSKDSEHNGVNQNLQNDKQSQQKCLCFTWCCHPGELCITKALVIFFLHQIQLSVVNKCLPSYTELEKFW